MSELPLNLPALRSAYEQRTLRLLGKDIVRVVPAGFRFPFTTERPPFAIAVLHAYGTGRFVQGGSMFSWLVQSQGRQQSGLDVPFSLRRDLDKARLDVILDLDIVIETLEHSLEVVEPTLL